MNVTKIEWTTFSANPIKYRDADGKSVWACVHHSPGCLHCYAETLAKRYGRGGPFNVQTTSKVTPYLDEKELRQMLTAKTIQGVPVSGSRVFVGDMTDIFGEWVPDDLLDRLFAVFALRPDVTWQVLTKRAKRMRAYMAAEETPVRWVRAARAMGAIGESWDPSWIGGGLANVWLGVSAEDQQRADERIPLLLDTPAAVRFVSAEPLIGPIEFKRRQLGQGADCDECHVRDVHVDEDGCCQSCGADAIWYGIDWVIVGGESGPGARPCDVAWVGSIVKQCRAAGVACFVKQLGARPFEDVDRVDVTEHAVFGPEVIRYSEPRDLDLRDRKGGDWTEWPIYLRVREFPRVEVPA